MPIPETDQTAQPGVVDPLAIFHTETALSAHGWDPLAPVLGADKSLAEFLDGLAAPAPSPAPPAAAMSRPAPSTVARSPLRTHPVPVVPPRAQVVEAAPGPSHRVVAAEPVATPERVAAPKTVSDAHAHRPAQAPAVPVVVPVVTQPTEETALAPATANVVIAPPAAPVQVSVAPVAIPDMVVTDLVAPQFGEGPAVSDTMVADSGTPLAAEPAPAPVVEVKPPVGLDRIFSRHVSLSSDEALAIVDRLFAAIEPDDAEQPAPEFSGILLHADGHVEARPGSKGESPAIRMGHILHALLPAGSTAVPLRLLVSKWIASSEPRTIQDLAAELAYFVKSDSGPLVAAVYDRCTGAAAPRHDAAPAKVVQEKAKAPRKRRLNLPFFAWD